MKFSYTLILKILWKKNQNLISLIVFNDGDLSKNTNRGMANFVHFKRFLRKQIRHFKIIYWVIIAENMLFDGTTEMVLVSSYSQKMARMSIIWAVFYHWAEILHGSSGDAYFPFLWLYLAGNLAWSEASKLNKKNCPLGGPFGSTVITKSYLMHFQGCLISHNFTKIQNKFLFEILADWKKTDRPYKNNLKYTS